MCRNKQFVSYHNFKVACHTPMHSERRLRHFDKSDSPINKVIRSAHQSLCTAMLSSTWHAARSLPKFRDVATEQALLQQSRLRRAGRHLASADDKTFPLSLLKDEPRDHPSGRDDLCQFPVVASERGGSVARKRHRHQLRNRSVLVEQIWPNTCR